VRRRSDRQFAPLHVTPQFRPLASLCPTLSKRITTIGTEENPRIAAALTMTTRCSCRRMIPSLGRKSRSSWRSERPTSIVSGCGSRFTSACGFNLFSARFNPRQVVPGSITRLPGKNGPFPNECRQLGDRIDDIAEAGAIGSAIHKAMPIAAAKSRATETLCSDRKNPRPTSGGKPAESRRPALRGVARPDRHRLIGNVHRCVLAHLISHHRAQLGGRHRVGGATVRSPSVRKTTIE
jgi:hypothetical protein